MNASFLAAALASCVIVAWPHQFALEPDVRFVADRVEAARRIHHLDRGC
jgi:hypothetical protein